MRTILTPIVPALLLLVCVTGLSAQQIQPPTVPRLLRISSSFHPASGLPVAPVESVTLSVYREEQGGTPLWQETQNVTIDADGRYTVLMGGTLNEGVPLDLFNSGEPRWLGVQFNRPGETEQPRVRMASVAYALKASDAETLGGKPASAYMLAPSLGNDPQSPAESRTASSETLNPKAAKPKAITGTPTMNSIVKFTDSSGDIGNSIVTDNGTSIAVAGQAAVGSGHSTQSYGYDLYINGPNPVALIDAYANPGTASLMLQGRGTGASNQQLSVNSTGVFSVTPSSTGTAALAINQNGNLGVGTSAPGAKLDVIGQAAIGSGGSAQSYGYDLYVNGSNPSILVDAYANPGTASLTLQGRGASPSSQRLSVNNTGSFSVAPSSTGLTALAITQSSNVGIGTTTPGAKLEVAGNLKVSGTGNALIFPDGSQQTSAAATAGSGTAGYIPLWSTGTTLGNSALFQSGGNIGIGAAAPGAKLDVIGQAAIGSGGSTQSYGFDLYVNGSNPSVLVDAYANPGTASLLLQGRGSSASNQRLSVNSTGLFSVVPSSTGTTALAVTQSGNVGIGTTAPGAQLEVAGSLRVSGRGNALIFPDGTQQTSAAATSGSGTAGYIPLWGSSTTLGSSALFQTGGNVGIGTMMPGAALDVMGNINASGSVQLQDTPVLQTPGGSMGGNLSVGPFALPSNTTGNNNTAVGAAALTSNTTGANDTAIGNDALANNTTGSNNIAIGENAAVNVTGSNSNNIHIGNAGLSSDNNTIRIGTFGTQASFYAAGVTAPLIPSSNIVGLQVDTTTGQLGIMMSSRRYKEDIQNMGDASRNLMRLRPVTFRYRIPSAHGSKPIQYGLIAEEVAEVYPELVAHSANGQIETVNYQVLDSMLLNEVQRQEKEIDDLRQQNLALQQRLSRLEAVIANSPALTSNQ